MARKILFVGMILSFLSFVFVPGFAADKPASADTAKADLIKRGEYLVTLGSCNDCHSPKIFTDKGPELDPSRLLSGHPADSKLPEVPQGVIAPDKWGAVTNGHSSAWAGPWGVSFAANLTPDMETGTGSWSEEMFIKAMRTGKHLGEGRPILPPMPWPSYGQATDEDLKAMFAYLHSLKPVHNAVPDPIPPAASH